MQYSPAGTYLQQFPAIEPWRSGPENDRIDDPNGVAFDSAGRMYLSDTSNQRIQVFDMSSGTPVYSATIGVTDVISSTPGYFSEPLRIAIDLNDRLYVVDHRNNRVQKCVFSSGWSCTILDDTLNFRGA